MRTLIVVDNPKNWPFDIKGVEVVAARKYLANEEFGEARGAKVFNICRSYRYQTVGYYVSLLAEARGHKPVPRISTIQDLKSQAVIRAASDDLDEMIQRSLAPIQSDRFTLSVYFGRNMAKRHERLSSRLFARFHTPFLQAQFIKRRKWVLQSLAPIAASDAPEEHRDFIIEVASEYFARKRGATLRRRETRFDLAILRDPSEKHPASNDRAVAAFIKAAAAAGIYAEVVTKEDYGSLAEFDALFIRDTTSVNHYTFRFSRRAVAEGLVVLDDPESILKCANKVFLAELLRKRKIPTPETMIAHKDNLNRLPERLKFPLILKKPDSSFSQGVIKVNDEAELLEQGKRLLQDSELIIAQRFTPTDYDWRIGVLDKKPLYACRYYMADGHWQIIYYGMGGEEREGNAEGVPVESVPPRVLKTAVKAASLIGDGLYGVDVKEIRGKAYVMEVNDNPNIDAGFEDAVLKGGLYRAVMEYFLRKLERKKAGLPL